MADLFTAYAAQATGTKVHAYIIESTAPNNIDDVGIPSEQQDPHQIGADAVIDRIVNDLKNSENPTLVLSIHGFNNPRDIILDGYKNSFNSVVNDPAINNQRYCYYWISLAIRAFRRSS